MFIGLDGEMSGSNIEDGHKLIQLGFAIMKKGELISSFWQTMNPGEMEWSNEAYLVHNISREQILASPALDEADNICYDWLIGQGLYPKHRTYAVPVGFNVSGFDMPFVKQSLPKTYSIFSRRTVDLNAICFALEGKDGFSNYVWKRNAKEYALKKMGESEGNFKPHNAGYDAIMHSYCFEYLQKIVQGE